jgi:tetratricopeptide (TPR) repeat protein
LLFGCAGLPVDEKGDGVLLNLKEAVKRSPQNPEKHMELARLYEARYQGTEKIYFLDAGIKEALEAVRLKPTFRDAHLLIVHLLFLKPYSSLDEKIINELKMIQTMAMKEDPNFIEIEHFIPYQYFSAFIHYNKASKEKKYLDLAANELKEVIQLKPDLHGGHSMLGNIYFMQGKDELALFEAKEAVRLNSESNSSHLLLGDIYNKKSYSEKNCYDDEMIELSIREFKEALRLDPDEYYPHSMLGYLYRSKGLYDLSIFESKEALRLSGSPDHHIQLGIAFDRNGEYDEAVKEFNEALRLNPNLVTIHTDLAWEYLLLSRFIDSIAEVKKYLRSSGQKQPVDIILCQYLSMKQTGEISSSMQLLEDYAKNFKDKDWKFNLVQYILGKVSETEVVGSTRHRCDQAIVFFFIGYDYFVKGDKQKAIEYFQKVLDSKAVGFGVYTAARTMLERLDK